VSAGDPRKVACAHNSFLTSAKASEKVGWVLRYHAARRTISMLCVIGWWAKRVTSENNPNSALGDPSDGQIRPLPLCFHTQMPASFLKGCLYLPAQDEPPKDLLGFGAKIGA
jgi:hypothetical protein